VSRVGLGAHRVAEPIDDADRLLLCSSGMPVAGATVRIVDPERGLVLGEDTNGEI
jgi:hypothetical protein